MNGIIIYSFVFLASNFFFVFSFHIRFQLNEKHFIKSPTITASNDNYNPLLSLSISFCKCRVGFLSISFTIDVIYCWNDATEKKLSYNNRFHYCLIRSSSSSTTEQHIKFNYSRISLLLSLTLFSIIFIANGKYNGYN